jgi:hypothetical protein
MIPPERVQYRFGLKVGQTFTCQAEFSENPGEAFSKVADEEGVDEVG